MAQMKIRRKMNTNPADLIEIKSLDELKEDDLLGSVYGLVIYCGREYNSRQEFMVLIGWAVNYNGKIIRRTLIPVHDARISPEGILNSSNAKETLHIRLDKTNSLYEVNANRLKEAGL